MKLRVVVAVIVLLQLVGCNFPSYTYKNPVGQLGVDFRDGRWLINEMGTDYNDVVVYDAALKDLKKVLGGRISESRNTNGLLLLKVPMQPDKTQLRDMYLGTNFDYFVNIKTNILKDELLDIDLNSGSTAQGQDERVNAVMLEIYDLKKSTIIYSQTVQGYAVKQKNSGAVNFYKPNSTMLLKSYRKIWKDIIDKSITD